MSKKILAILMAVAMAFSLLPATALATTSGDDQQQSTLKPEAKHYNFDGTETTSENADITLTKTAAPVEEEDGVYEVPLTATTSQEVKPKPVEVVFVLDGSGSMGWCTENPPTGLGHTHDYGGWCIKTLKKKNHSKSRWNIAINAINQMVTNIGEDGVTYKYVLFSDDAEIVTSYNKNTMPTGATRLTEGVKKGITEFSENSGADKVMIIVADGESDDGYPAEQATAFKDAGGKIYTVGFLFSGNDFNNLSSGNGYQFTADNADQINLAMNTITQNIAGLISDPMGENVTLLQDNGISVKLGDQDTTAATVLNDNTIRWTKTDGFSGTVTMKYKVQVKDSAKTGKVLSIPLNNNATFNYVYNGTSHSVAFPQPEAQAAALTVSYKVGDKTVKTEEDYTLLGENAAFTKTIPSVGDRVDIGETTYYVSSTNGSVPEQLASEHYQVTVNLSETPPILGTVTVTVPNKTVTYDGTSQTGEADYTTSDLPGGYTLNTTYTPAQGTNANADGYTGKFGNVKITRKKDNVDVTNQFTIKTTPGKLIINKKAVTVTAENKSKVYGEENPPLTYTASGFVGEDNLTTLNIVPTLTTTAVKNSQVGEYPITFSNTTAETDNYTISYENATLTIGASQTYTVTYQWATGKEIPSDAALPEGNPFTLSVGAKHTVEKRPTSNITRNSKGETGKWTCSWDKSDVIEGSAGEQVVITGTWTFTKQEIEPTPDTSKPDVNKTATALVNDKTEVRLSVGGKSAKENVAVMFLLDKSTSMGTRTEAAKMLQHLKGLTNTNIIYDVVIFSGTASSTGWKDISNDAAYTDTEKKFTNKEPSSGTNMPVGIDQAIQDMETLKSQYSSYAENAYLITISDGITYLWNEEGKTYTVPLLQKEGDNVYTPAHVNVDTWDMMHGKGTPIASVYTSFEGFLNTIPGKIAETRNGNYVREYLTEMDAGDKTDATNALQISTADPEKSQVSSKYARAPEFSVYYSATKYQELVKQFEKSFALPMPELDNNNQNKMDNWESWYPWGKELMLYLQSNSSNSGQGVVYAADAEEIFAGIQNKILYQIQSGSITDVIGADFSLTDQTLTQNTFTLTVNGKAVTANAPSGNVITFGEKDKSTGKYPYMLTYYKGTATKNADNTYTITSGEKTYTYTPYDTNGEVNGSVSDEFFVLEMNVPVVSLDLKYNLSLTSKRTAAGRYEVPTNESATLAYTSANQSVGTVDFNEPTVSYTVKGSSGSHSGGSRPSLNTKDHYGYIIGYPVDYYTGQPTTDQTKKPVRPEGKITRAEVATIYFRMLTDESRAKFWSQSNSYSDVKAGDWFNNAVSTLSNAGIIAGYEDGSFKPNGYITRAEFATIAARFFDVTYNGKDLFPDISGHWAKDYINQAANKGFVNGYEDGTFKPDRNITRAEAVTLVNRTLDRHPDKNHFTKDMLVWPDNMDQTKWYYADMQEATNSHTYQMKENSDKTKYENWTKTLPIRNWEALEKAWSNANSSQGNGNVV